MHYFRYVCDRPEEYEQERFTSVPSLRVDARKPYGETMVIRVDWSTTGVYVCECWQHGLIMSWHIRKHRVAGNQD